MKIAFGRKATKIHDGKELKVNGVKHILQSLKISLPFNSYTWFIPKEIFISSIEVKKEWIRAFFDDETTVSINGRDIEINSVNRFGLLQVKKLLKDFGIDSTLKTYGKISRLRIGSKYLKIFEKFIGFKHPKKKRRLKILCQSS